jgi:gliding motility-associated-like protein
MMYFKFKTGPLILLLTLAVLFHPAGNAQAAGKDSVSYSSTCVNSTISFGTPLFDSITFPKFIKWDFGDPASGFLNGAGTQQPRHVYSAPGKYYISLKVLNSGATDTIFIRDSINIVSPMVYDFGPDIFLCEKKDTFLTAPVIPGAVYTWNDDSLTHSDTLRIAKSGVYTVSINGCGVTDSVGVFVSTTPKIGLGKDHVLCTGEILELDATTQNGHYAWMLNGAPLPSQDGQLPVVDPGGAYIATVTVPGCGVYKDTVSITFSKPDAPAFSLGPDTLLCPRQVYTLTAAAAGATAYDWSTDATGPTISITNEGLYWAFVTIGTCQVVDTVDVTYRGDKKLDFRDTAICHGSTLSLDADFGTGTYNWQSVPPQRDDQNQTGQSTYFVYKAGTYSITATVGQCVYTDTLTVSFNDSLKLNITGDTTLCNGETFWLKVNGNANTFTWQDGAAGPAYQVTKTGAYTVVAENGCGKDTLMATIQFVSCACNLLLPNAFTPDGNGINDNFRPLHACQMTNYEMAIFDRTGNMVFHSSDPATGWDGKFRGDKVPSGNFVWMVRYFSTETKLPVFKKGQVLVIR